MFSAYSNRKTFEKSCRTIYVRRPSKKIKEKKNPKKIHRTSPLHRSV